MFQVHEAVAQALSDLMEMLPLNSPNMLLLQSAETFNAIFDFTLTDEVLFGLVSTYQCSQNLPQRRAYYIFCQL